MSTVLATEVLAAVRHDLANYMAHFQPPVAVLREEALLVLTGGPTADFNFGVVEPSTNDEAVFRQFVAQVRTAGVQAMFMLPSALRERLAAVARDEGLSEAGTAPLMVLESVGTTPPVAASTSFKVERVQDAAGMGIVADLIASAFGLDRDWVGRVFAAPPLLDTPGVRFWLATRDGEPYSTLTSTGGGPVGIWSMATAPEHQRQGAGRAVLEAAVSQYRREGNSRFYLIATPAGKPLYDALGFTTVDNLAIWTAGHSEQFGGH